MESWTEIRCVACQKLGWESSRLLLKVHGHIVPSASVTIQLKCHRCKSIIEWTLGTPILVAVVLGEKNRRRSHAAFE